MKLPTNAKIASNYLGQGDNSSLKTPIAPVDILRSCAKPSTKRWCGSPPPPKLYGAVELVRITGISFRHNQPLRTSVSCRIKVHTAGGVLRYGTLNFDLKPTVERLYVNRLVVLNAAGKQVAEGIVDNYFIVDDSSSGIATNSKIVNIPVPGLKPGHTIEYTITREERFPSESFSFQHALLSSSVPVGVSAFFVEGDVEGLKYETSLPISVAATNKVIHCVVANPPPICTESRQQPLQCYLPMIWVGDESRNVERRRPRLSTVDRTESVPR